MTPEQFLQKVQKEPPAPVYLFLGPEPYQRALCRKALLEKVLRPEEIEDGFTRHDLDEISLNAVLDDARSLSLFAPNRLLWITGAEVALPKRLSSDDEDDASGRSALKHYLRDASSPGSSATVLVFEASRFGFDGEDKAKLERVQKFYAAIPNQIEFRPYTPESARRLAQDLARQSGLQIGLSEIGLLIDVLGGDAGRIASEIEKLRLFAGPGRKVTADDIRELVPNAQATTIFALVAALGRGDRKRSFESLDVLLREGEYLPLALTFLATQLRLAKVAQEANLRSANQIQTYFTKQGIRIWRDRAEQVHQTLSVFSKERLNQAIGKVFWADKALRDARPDDRLVMEELLLSLTS
ncbi:MAG: DNA polymerase III subunit delta [Acidobacteriota bacterium]|nr:DNA polymerase III subunit delta [Acidobacteriota bacterium]